MDTFTCEVCKETFKKALTDEEAMKEYETSEYNIPGDEVGVICDHCFDSFQQWYAKTSAALLKKMRKKPR